MCPKLNSALFNLHCNDVSTILFVCLLNMYFKVLYHSGLRYHLRTFLLLKLPFSNIIFDSLFAPLQRILRRPYRRYFDSSNATANSAVNGHYKREDKEWGVVVYGPILQLLIQFQLQLVLQVQRPLRQISRTPPRPLL
jgi:hypothetical protein